MRVDENVKFVEELSPSQENMPGTWQSCANIIHAKGDVRASDLYIQTVWTDVNCVR